jgi:hypothetical protein
MKVFNGVWICSLKQKSKGTIKLYINIHMKVLHICIGLKHYVLWFCEGTTHIFLKLAQMKYPH